MTTLMPTAPLPAAPRLEVVADPLPADRSDVDDLLAAVRELDDTFAAEADRYSRWADELDKTGFPAAADLARQRADDYNLIVRGETG